MSPGKVYGERFAVVPESVLYAPVSDRAMRLWSILNRYADPEGHAHPGRKTLSEHLRCSLTSLDRAIAELKDVGLLTVKPRFREDQDGEQTSNDYRLISGPPLPTDAATPSPPTRPKGKPVEGNVGTTYLRAGAKSERPRDPIWDAFVAVFGQAPDTRTERGRWNKAAKELRDIGVIATDIQARADRWPDLFPGARLTPLALVANWGLIGQSLTSTAPVLCPKCLDPLGAAHTDYHCQVQQRYLATVEADSA